MDEKTSVRKYSAIEIIFLVAVLIVPYIIVQVLSALLAIVILLLLGSFIILAIAGIFQLVAGVAMFGVGVEKLFSIPMGAFAVMGFGITNIGIALLLECFVLWVYGVALPFCIRKIVKREDKNEKTS